MEDCDGGVDNSVTCQSLGQGIGTVRCSNLCKFETSFCVVYGDRRINPNLEECEGSDFEGESCASLGYKEGILACDAECNIDDSGCSGVSDNCGDGQLRSPEECDGLQLGGKTCALLGFDGGLLSCSTACGHDTSQCFGGEPTNNNTINDMGSTQTPNPANKPPLPNDIIGKGTCATAGNSNSFLFGILVFLLGFIVPRR